MSETLRKIEALEAELQKLKNEVKPKYEENKWYKSKTNQLVFITEFRDYDVIGYGFGNKNDWFDISEWMDGWKSLELRLANHQEVEEALIKEAKKRGFKEGVRFKSALYKYDCVITTYEFDFHFDYMDMCKNVLFCNGNAIFSNGVWAEIVKDKTIKIGGYSVEKMGESYRVGCKRFEITDFIDAKRLIEKAGVQPLRFESIEINIETINKILAL